MLDDEDYPQDLFRNFCANLMELAVSVGLINSVSAHFPEHAQENWLEKLQHMDLWVHQQIEEVQSFAEAYDEE